jgi:hypothetical protein
MSRTGLVIRNQLTKLLSIPWFATLVARKSIVDRIALPDETQDAADLRL